MHRADRRFAGEIAWLGEYFGRDMLGSGGHRDGLRARRRHAHRLPGGECCHLRIAVLFDQLAEADVAAVIADGDRARVFGERPRLRAPQDVGRAAIHAEGVERRLLRVGQDVACLRRLAWRGGKHREAAAGRDGHLTDAGYGNRRRLLEDLQGAWDIRWRRLCRPAAAEPQLAARGALGGWLLRAGWHPQGRGGRLHERGHPIVAHHARLLAEGDFANGPGGRSPRCGRRGGRRLRLDLQIAQRFAWI